MQLDDRRFVYAIARRIVRNDDTAHDVAQDALLTAFVHRHQFRGESSYRTWLYKIATTAALSTLRRERARRRGLDAVTAAVETGTPPGAAEPPLRADLALERAFKVARLEEQLAQLDTKYRRVLEICVHEGKSEGEAAAALGISTGAVKVRAFRARNMLRDRVGAS
jgi:RNA polymerase sigma-70 factor (ECF subfamily)